MHKGQVEEVNILTATKLRWWPFQRLGFFIARRSLWAAEHLVRQRGVPLQLKRLNFLHEGRWVALGRFPKAGLKWRERERFLGVRWVLFCSNFNQGWMDYLLAFLDSFGSGISSLWGESEGFPEFPVEGTYYDALNYVDSHLVPTQHYFAAYPDASTNDVRTALRLERETAALAGERAAELTNARLTDMLRSLQPCLYDTWNQAQAAPEENAMFSPARNGMVGLVTTCPIRPGLEPELTGELGRIKKSELAYIGGVHFARLFLIDRNRPTRGQRRTLRNSWLVFAIVFDADVAELQASGQRSDRFIDRIVNRNVETPTVPRPIVDDLAGRMASDPDFVECIWGHCRGPALRLENGVNAENVATMLWEGRARNLMSFRDYPDATVASVTTALDERQRLAAELVANPGEPTDALGTYVASRRSPERRVPSSVQIPTRPM